MVHLKLTDCGRPYRIYFTQKGWRNLALLLSRQFGAGKVILFSQKTVWRHFGAAINKELLRVGFVPICYLLPEGEQAKSWGAIQKAWRWLQKLKVDRATPIVAVGGGTVGDAAGFVAATFKRGVPLVHVPTTLLAQVDSAIGGKVGVNEAGAKNVVGTFYSPTLVYINLAVLKKMGPRAWRSGWAEVIKIAAVADARLWRWLEKGPPSQKETKRLAAIIQRAIRAKGQIVRQDPKDQKGIRAKLNFGHTIGHAVESHGRLQKWNHGEAVAIGMMEEALVAKKMGFCSQKTCSRLQSLLTRYGLPVNGKPPLYWMKWFEEDKKRRGKNLSFVFLEKISRVRVATLPLAKLKRCIQSS